MTELDAEVGVLRVGLKDIEKELTYYQKKAICNDGRKDKFVSVMNDFVTVAAYNFSELEEQVIEMKQRVSTKKILSKSMQTFYFKYYNF